MFREFRDNAMLYLVGERKFHLTMNMDSEMA